MKVIHPIKSIFGQVKTWIKKLVGMLDYTAFVLLQALYLSVTEAHPIVLA